MADVRFLPEGNLENTLLIFFKVHPKIINIQSGSHYVAKSMLAQKDVFHRYLVGIVDDDDENVPTYFNDFAVIEEDNGLFLKHKPKTNHYLIVVFPEAEEWLLNTAKLVGVNPRDFSLPDNPGKLHDITSNFERLKEDNFKGFLKAIRDAKAPAFNTFQNYLNHFYSR